MYAPYSFGIRFDTGWLACGASSASVGPVGPVGPRLAIAAEGFAPGDSLTLQSSPSSDPSSFVDCLDEDGVPVTLAANGAHTVAAIPGGYYRLSNDATALSGASPRARMWCR